ncbi:AMP-binding protein [Bacillus amyloliquefaciens]|nr:AMP-binding protein [Bacillus amyloliquefaciens]
MCGEYSSGSVLDDTAYIIYTSGTTGTSKGVEVRK